MDIATLISLLTALGAGGAIGQYIGAGRARREVRSDVLNALAMTEQVRWAHTTQDKNLPRFRDAVHKLETAALIARVPRPAVQQYVLLADASWRYSLEDFNKKQGDTESFAGGVESLLVDVVKDSAEVILQLAWRPWLSRMAYRQKLSKIRNRAARIKSVDVRRHVIASQAALGRSAGALGELYDGRPPKA